MVATLGNRVLVPDYDGSPISIFTNAWELNGKCIAFGVVLCIIYLIPSIQLGIANFAICLMIMAIAYIAMAMYDEYYECGTGRMKSSKNTLTGALKNPIIGVPSPTMYTVVEREAERDYLNTVYRAHAQFIGPLIMLLGLANWKYGFGYIGKSQMPKYIKPLNILLFGLGGTAMGYHGIRMVHPRKLII